MDGKWVLIGLGIVLVLCNKLIAGMFVWWEMNVTKIEEPKTLGIYRVILSVIGAVLLVMGIFQMLR